MSKVIDDYVKKEAQLVVNQMFPLTNEHETKAIARQEHYNGILYGLTAGIERMKEYTEWYKKRGYYATSGYAPTELIELFLIEKQKEEK